MKCWRWLGTLLLVLMGGQWCQAAEEKKTTANSWGDYEAVAKTAHTKLVEVFGSQEQEPTFGFPGIFSRDGKLLFSSSGGNQFNQEETGAINVLEVASGRTLRQIKIKGGLSAFSPTSDNKQAVVASFTLNPLLQPRLDLRNLTNAKVERNLLTPKEIITALALDQDGDKVLVGSQDGRLRLIAAANGKEILNLAGHGQQGVITVSFTAQGKQAVSGGQDNTLKVWDLVGGKLLRTIKVPNWPISLSVSPDGRWAAISGVNETVRLFDLATGKEVEGLNRPLQAGGVGNAVMSPDGRKLLAAWIAQDPTGQTLQIQEGSLSFWDIGQNKEVWAKKAPLRDTPAIFLEPDGQHALIGGGANPLTRWELATGKLLRVWGGHKGAISALAFDSKGGLVSAGQDRFLIQRSGEKDKVWWGHGGPITALALASDSKQVLTASADKTLKLWDLAQGQEIRSFAGHAESVTGAALSADGQLALSSSGDRSLKLWDVASGKELQTLTGHGDAVNAVALSPDGKWVASASDDHTIRLWPLTGHKQEGEPRVLKGHDRQVTCLAFTADGKQLLSGSQDQTLKLWDLAKGKAIHTFKGHKNWVSSLAVHGGLAASASDDLTVRLWDLNSAKQLDVLDLGRCGDCPRAVALSPDTLAIGTTGWMVLRFAVRQ